MGTRRSDSSSDCSRTAEVTLFRPCAYFHRDRDKRITIFTPHRTSVRALKEETKRIVEPSVAVKVPAPTVRRYIAGEASYNDYELSEALG